MERNGTDRPSRDGDAPADGTAPGMVASLDEQVRARIDRTLRETAAAVVVTRRAVAEARKLIDAAKRSQTAPRPRRTAGRRDDARAPAESASLAGASG